MNLSNLLSLAPLLLAASLPLSLPGQSRSFTPWEPGASIDPAGALRVNTSFQDGCPIESPDAHSLFIASDRPGGKGGIDIWVSYRQSRNHPWSEPVNLPEPVNSASNDFCPTPLSGGRLMFVSNRPNDCGGGTDIYETRLHHSQGWMAPRNLGCAVNSPGNEFSPSLVEARGRTILFFSSDRQGNHDIYSSMLLDNGTWTPAQAVTELNSPVDDARPNVRADGLEIVFDSIRGGGPPDIYSSTRANLAARWSVPVRLGPEINSTAAETRPSISRDGRRLYFGTTREGVLGSADVFMSVRWNEGRR